ncbi:MAG: putative N-acyltransferase [Gammaproteobacteria bacterium]
MLSSNLIVKHHESLETIAADEWNHLTNNDNPFLRYEFLSGLETTNCLQPEGWIPRHLTVESGGKVLAALPLYIRTNSYGEFVFDWAWADAYERAGGNYYPKLVSAIPFTPVRGQRLLIDKNFADPARLRQLIVEQLLETTESTKISSFHCLFPTDDDVSTFSDFQLLKRKSFQFHWHNQGYRDFQDFLDNLTRKKRKQIKRERRQAVEAGVEVEILKGNEINDEQWTRFYDFYCSTFHRRWGNPRLTLEFFKLLSEKMPSSTLLILAKQDGDYIAGAFAMLGNDTLYGRHWGCSKQLSFLHFELCYYQTIEYCINNGLQVLDAGVQGEHKLSRGFAPVATWSCHWIRHEGFRRSVDDFLIRETKEIDFYLANLNQHLPYKSPTSQHDDHQQRPFK